MKKLTFEQEAKKQLGIELEGICAGIENRVPGDSTSYFPNAAKRKELIAVLSGVKDISFGDGGKVFLDTKKSISTSDNTIALVMFTRIDGRPVFSGHHFFSKAPNRKKMQRHGHWEFIGVDGEQVTVEYPPRGAGVKEDDAGVFPVASTRSQAVLADKHHVDQAAFEGHPISGTWMYRQA